MQSLAQGHLLRQMVNTNSDGKQEQRSTSGLEGLPRPWFRQLIRDCLKRKDRLQLFRVSKALADSVVEHSPQIKLHLKVGDQETCSTEQVAANQQAMKALLAPAHESTKFKVKLEGGKTGQGEAVPTTWEALPRRQITYLTLDQINLTINTLRKLQLQQCTQLQTLCIEGGVRFSLPGDLADREPGVCGPAAKLCRTPRVKAALSKLRAAYFPPSLFELHVCDHMEGGDDLGAVLGPQITSFLSSGTVPTTFTSVTHFQHTWKTCSDDDLDSILKVPSLTHVTVQWPELEKDRRFQTIKWQQLLFKRGAELPSLVALPVWSIQELIVRDQLMTMNVREDMLDKAVLYLGLCPNFKCMPMHNAALGMPVFFLGDVFSPTLISMCAHSLTEPGCLRFYWLRPGFWDILLQALPLLSDAAKVTCLAFVPDHLNLFTDEQLEQFWQKFVAALPSHITLLSFEKWTHDDECIRQASILIPLLAGSQHHQRTTVDILLSNKNKSFPQQLQELMQKYPGKLHVRHDDMAKSFMLDLWLDD